MQTEIDKEKEGVDVPTRAEQSILWTLSSPKAYGSTLVRRTARKSLGTHLLDSITTAYGTVRCIVYSYTSNGFGRSCV